MACSRADMDSVSRMLTHIVVGTERALEVLASKTTHVGSKATQVIGLV